MKHSKDWELFGKVTTFYYYVYFWAVFTILILFKYLKRVSCRFLGGGSDFDFGGRFLTGTTELDMTLQIMM